MNRIASVLKRVEPSCYVKVAIPERQLFDLADVNICAGAAAPGDFRQSGRCVQPANSGTASLCGRKG